METKETPKTKFPCKHPGCEETSDWDQNCDYHLYGGMLGSGETYEQYQIIEQDFINFIRAVPLEEKHLDVVTSPVLRDIIIRTCVQIELFFKEWAKEECGRDKECHLWKKYDELDKTGVKKGEKNWTIKDYSAFSQILNDSIHSIHVMPLNVNVFPFANWTAEKDSLWWWAAYNSLKHGGRGSQAKATLKCALYALAGLFSMHCKNRHSAYYLQKFCSLSIDTSFNRVTVRSGDITTPIDSKKYLFKANHTNKTGVDLVTTNHLQKYDKAKGRF